MSSVKILLIDTNTRILATATRLLETKFQVVGSFNDCAVALREVLPLDPDIVLLDISLGDVNGLEIARRIKLLGCKAKVVFFTLHDQPDFIQAAAAVGAAGYIFKNQAVTDLVKGIEQVSSGNTYFPKVGSD